MNNFVEFLSSDNKDFLFEIQLICIALNIENKIIDNSVFIKESEIKSAYKNINEYFNENFSSNNDTVNKKPDESINLYFSYILIFSFIIFHYFVHNKFKFLLYKGANNAFEVINGKFWLCFTGLTLHGNIVHLFSNILFLLVLLKPIVRIYGEGKGWMLILFTGFWGNIFSDFVYRRFHSSIGLSTALFGIVGILSFNGFLTSRNSIVFTKKFLPIVAGLALLAFTGTGGENTDIIAHLSGFIAGIFIAAIYNYKPVLFFDFNDLYYKFFSIFLLVLSWLLVFWI